MPKTPNDPLWDKIDALATEASQQYGQHHVAHILTQITIIARTYKRAGIKQLFSTINLHCANLLSEVAGEVDVDTERKGR